LFAAFAPAPFPGKLDCSLTHAGQHT
jgi:hypothetical protein